MLTEHAALSFPAVSLWRANCNSTLDAWVFAPVRTISEALHEPHWVHSLDYIGRDVQSCETDTFDWSASDEHLHAVPERWRNRIPACA